mgnify:CR=1 FL=1
MWIYTPGEQINQILWVQRLLHRYIFISISKQKISDSFARKYQFFQGSFNAKIARSLQEILYDRSVQIKVKQAPKIMDYNIDQTISEDFARKLIDDLTGIVHNDAGE